MGLTPVQLSGRQYCSESPIQENGSYPKARKVAWLNLSFIMVFIVLSSSACVQSEIPERDENPSTLKTDTPTSRASNTHEPQNTADPTTIKAKEPETRETVQWAPTDTLEPTVVPEDPWADIDPSGQIVNFWHWHTTGRVSTLNEIVAEFNAINEWDITVQVEYQTNSEMFNKMLGVINTSYTPHLVMAYQNQAAAYYLADGVVDMTPLVASPKWGLPESEEADFFPGILAQDLFPNFEDARLGFPTERSMEVLYYNIDWLEELKDSGKIDFDGPPTTTEQFTLAACAAVEQPFSRATTSDPIGYELSFSASRFASWTFAHGGDLFDYSSNTYSYDSQEAQQAMEFIQNLFDRGCAATFDEAYLDEEHFGVGKTLFTTGTSYAIPFYERVVSQGARFRWHLAAFPHTTIGPVQNVYGPSISITKSTPEAQLAAWLFLRYFTSPEVQAKWSSGSNYLPVRVGVTEQWRDDSHENEARKTAFDMLKYGYFEPRAPGYDFVRDLAREAMAAMADGEDVASTLARLNLQANAILAEVVSSPMEAPAPVHAP